MRGNPRSKPVKHFKTPQEAYEAGVLTLDEYAGLILYKDAVSQAQGFGEYCKTHGIVGPAQERRIKRHEVPLKEGNHSIDGS